MRCPALHANQHADMPQRVTDSSGALHDIEAGKKKEAVPVLETGEVNGYTQIIPPMSASHEPKVVSTLSGYVQRFETYLTSYNLEARGIKRVGDDERLKLGWKAYLQIFVLWFSINLAANNITLGMLGPQVFELSFLDSALTGVLGCFAGSIPAAWIAIWGPISGNRAMVFGRYAMGWWPSKLIVLLNLIVLLGYSMIDCVVGGQILSAVSPDGNMSVIVGIVIIAVVSWAVSTFGITLFHEYERWAFIPQLIVYCILAGVSARHYDTHTPTSLPPATTTGNRLSFFSICLSAAITYSGGAADFFVYYPPTTSRPTLFFLTILSLSLSFTFTLLLGIGLASGVSTTPAYATALSKGQGSLLVEGFAPLGTFGKFCAVITALGLIANTIPPTYISGIDFQVLGRHFLRVPRFIWNTIGVIIYASCALAGRNSLAGIFTNFLALMGYWVAIWIAILLEECYIFRKRKGYDWDAWNERERLPVGCAALVAFLVGWVGAILCMSQVWYVGPIARQVGEFGADMGNYVGFGWAALVYPPLRYYELKRFGR